jgi:hypothetical protein
MRPRSDGKFVVDVTRDAALRLDNGDHDANWRSQLAGDADRGAGLRQIDHAAGDIGAVGQHEARHWIARRKPAVAAIFWKVENLPVGQLCKPRCELVALAQRGRDRHCKSVFESARDLARRRRWST